MWNWDSNPWHLEKPTRNKVCWTKRGPSFKANKKTGAILHLDFFSCRWVHLTNGSKHARFLRHILRHYVEPRTKEDCVCVCERERERERERDSAREIESHKFNWHSGNSAISDTNHFSLGSERARAISRQTIFSRRAAQQQQKQILGTSLKQISGL